MKCIILLCCLLYGFVLFPNVDLGRQGLLDWRSVCGLASPEPPVLTVAELMRRYHVPLGSREIRCDSWRCPKAVVVDAQRFLVETGRCFHVKSGICQLFSLHTPMVRIEGDVLIACHEEAARSNLFDRCLFDSSSRSSQLLRNMSVSYESPGCYVVSLKRKNQRERTFLAYKNLTFSLAPCSNAVSIIKGVLRSGLE